MKHRFNNFVKLSIFILCICFTVNVSAQEPCEWGTNVLTKYEKCVNDLRADYNAMVKNKINHSTKYNMSRKKVYDTLLKQYEKLITHYDKKSTRVDSGTDKEEKVEDFTEKLESLKKTKN